MLRNYLKIAWRNIWKHKLFSAINIISLAIGLSASFVIGMMCYYDFTFDQFHPDKERIYRVTTIFNEPDGKDYFSGVALPLADAIRTHTALEETALLLEFNPTSVQNTDQEIKIKNPEFSVVVDTSYFKIFQYQFLAGTAQGLNQPNTVVLTEARAKQYFPNTNVSKIIGKTLSYNDNILVEVVGVVSPFKNPTELVFEEFISNKTIAKNGIENEFASNSWGSSSSSTNLFVKLKSLEQKAALETRLKELADENRSEYDIKNKYSRTFFLQAVTDIHLNNQFGIYDYNQPRSSLKILKGLGFIALFLLLLGCINFINLNTAQATQRAKEIGIRKTLGSSKKQLVFQFLGETFLLTLMACVVSSVFGWILLHVFTDFMPKGLDYTVAKEPLILLGIVVLVVLVVFLSGLYPALILSKYKPARVLKGAFFVPKKKSFFRSGLTVFQFVIAQVFIIATFLVGKQIHFMLNKDMGFATNAIAYVEAPFRTNTIAKARRLEQEFKAIPSLEKVVVGGRPPASNGVNINEMSYVNGDDKVVVPLQFLFGMDDYLDLYDIPLLAGRFQRNDTIKELVINETCLRKMGLSNPEEAIGKEFLTHNNKKILIVGVMRDFHQRDLKSTIEPMALSGDWSRKYFSQFRFVHFQLPNNHNWAETIASIDKVYKQVYPESDMELKFIDETIANFYKREQSLSKLLTWATGLSILISCLGLLGLVIYTTERRVKEIGVRKVLGATVTQLNALLCKEFVWLVVIAFVIAAPLAYYGISQWIQDFAYRTSLSWWVFVLSGLLMLLVALLIMSVKTIATACANPVDSLRTE